MGTSRNIGVSRASGRAISVACFLGLFSLGQAHASPWGRADGEWLVISRFNYFEADLGLINTLDGLVESRFERLDADTYVEFGLSEHIALGGKAIYGTSWLTRGASQERAAGFSEIEIFAQHRLLLSPRHAGAVRIAVSRPAQFSSGARPELQNDGYDLEAGFSYGRNIAYAPLKIFAVAETAYRKRFSAAADQIRLQATIGAEPDKRILLLAEAFATLSVRNERIGGADYDILKIQPSAVWRFSKRFSLQAGVTKEIASRNIARGDTYFLSLWSRF